jgi:hypothetical protein
LYTEWTKHLKDPEAKSSFEKAIYGSKDVLDHLGNTLKEKEEALDRSEINQSSYDTPNWAVRQAHKNGNREVIAYLRRLIDLDHQRRPNG